MVTFENPPPLFFEPASNTDFLSRLDLWFSTHARKLPWRSQRTVYETWVSEVMSQQTTLAVVVPRFLEFMKELPHADFLANATEDVLRRLWAGLGYYSRARNLQKAAQVVCLQGGFPNTFEGWLSLPGVGPYTAAMVASLCYGVPVAAVDGNVMRVVCRLTANPSPLVWTPAGQAAVVAQVQALMSPATTSGIGPGVVNEALIELGATVCRKQNPQCGVCPVQAHCQAFAINLIDICPVKKPRAAVQDVSLDIHIHYSLEKKAVALVERSGPWLSKTVGFPVHASPPGTFGGGLFDTPPQKLGPLLLGEFRHTITHHRIKAHVLGNPGIPMGGQHRWVPWDEVGPNVSTSLDKKAWQLFSQHVKNNPRIGRLPQPQTR